MIKKIMILITILELIVLTLLKQEFLNYLCSVICIVIISVIYTLLQKRIFNFKEKDQYPINIVKTLCLVTALIINFALSVLLNLNIVFNIISYILIVLLVNVILSLVLTLVKTNEDIVDKNISNEKNINKWEIYVIKVKQLYKNTNREDLNELYEKLRYSDPVNNLDISLDKEIFDMIDRIDENDSKEIKSILQKIDARNEYLKNLK